ARVRMIFRARTRTSWPFPLAEALTGCYSNRRKRRLTHLIAPLTIFLITLFFILWRSRGIKEMWFALAGAVVMYALRLVGPGDVADLWAETGTVLVFLAGMLLVGYVADQAGVFSDRKSTRLNSSHVKISYAVFCLKKKIH